MRISEEGGMSAGQNFGCEISGEGGTSAGQNSGCEISGEGGTSAGQNSGCEMSGEGGTSAGQNSSPGGMSYVARRKGNRLRVQGVGTPPPDDTECASLSGATPSGFLKRTRGALSYPDSLREKHTALAIITPRR